MMYVASGTLTCRVDPAAQSSVVEKLTRGDQVDAGETQGDWVKLDRIGEDCWVVHRFLSESPPPIETEPASPINRLYSSLPSDGPASLASPSTGRSCGAKWKCGQMDSCSEAYHYLNDCGVGRLDGDGDGVPCESIC